MNTARKVEKSYTAEEWMAITEMAERLVEIRQSSHPNSVSNPVPSGPRTRVPPAPASERRMADPETVEGFLRHAATNTPKTGPAHAYEGKWGSLVDALGGVDRCAAAIGVNPATMYRWAMKQTKPNSRSVLAVRTVAKAAKVPSPL
jgi:hypothetical protein